ncbi:MAG: hypothetical protein ABI579_03725 [Candidatus Sumerlaeota bacterium]
MTMQLEGPPIEIHIHTADGNVYSFYQDKAEEIARIISSIQPQKVFAQRHLLIAGSFFMAGFPADEITRIDLAMDQPVEWEFLHNLQSVEEITTQEFEDMRSPVNNDVRRSSQNVPVGEFTEYTGEIMLRDGQQLCLRIIERVGLKIDQRQNIQNMFASAGFHVKRRDGGVIIVNPTLITRWAFYPGPADIPKNAWQAHRSDLGVGGGNQSQSKSSIFR